MNVKYKVSAERSLAVINYFRQAITSRRRYLLIVSAMTIILLSLLTSCTQPVTAKLGGKGVPLKGEIGVFLNIDKQSDAVDRTMVESEFLKHLPAAVYEGNFKFRIVTNEEAAQDKWGLLKIDYSQDSSNTYNATLQLKTREGTQTSWDLGVSIGGYDSDDNKAKARFWRSLKDSPLIIYNPGYLSPAPGYGGKELWRYTPPDGEKPTDTALMDNRAYFSTGKAFYAMDVETGKVIWKISDTVLIAADPVGLKRWWIDGINVVEAPCDELFIESARDSMARMSKDELDAARAELKNLPSLGTGNSSGLIYYYDIPYGRYLGEWQVSESNIVYIIVGYLESHEIYVYAIDGNTGRRLWDYPGSQTLLANGMVYITAYHRELVPFFFDYTYNDVPKLAAVDPQTGQAKWEVERPEGSGLYNADNQTIYLKSEYHLYAFDAVSGQQKWQAAMENFNPFDDTIITTPETVYIKMTYGGATEDILALDSNNGQPKWRFKTDEYIREVVFKDGIVYLTTDRRQLLALDAATGEQKWSFNKYLYISHLNIIGTWETDTWENAEGGDEPFGNILVVGNSVYISHGCGLYCLDIQTGETKWKLGILNDPEYIFQQGGKLYYCDYTPYYEIMTAVDINSGEKVWQLPIFKPVERLEIYQNTLLVYTKDTVHFINPETGRPGWYMTFDGDIQTMSKLVNNTICIATTDYVYAVR